MKRAAMVGLLCVLLLTATACKVKVGPGDTDGFDSNGDIYINGGTTDVIAPFSAFDCNGNAAINGGTVRVNGQVIHEITCEGGPPPH